MCCEYGNLQIIIFYQQTIMFRKKHSDIDIKVPARLHSPFKSPTPRSPLGRNLTPKNISPIKNRTLTPTRRSQRPSFVSERPSKSPRNDQNTFQAQLESLGQGVAYNYDAKRGAPVTKGVYKPDNKPQDTYFSNLSNYSKGHQVNQGLKESKRLFTKCIGQMNSEKKKGSDFSKQLSNVNATPTTSFKSQIQMVTMIESVLPQPSQLSAKKMSFQECKKAIEKEKEQKPLSKKIEEQKDTQKRESSSKKEQIFALINQSFSNVGVSQIKEEIKVFTVEGLDQKAKLLQSVYQSDISDYSEFDKLLQRIELRVSPKIAKQCQHSVNISIESTKGGLTMDPFM